MKKYLAELVGTFVLTFLGCAAAMALNCSSNCAEVANAGTVIGTAVAFGLSVVAMAYTIGGISGCHINPAITLGVLLSGRMSVKDAIGYIVGQVIGGILAGALLLYFANSCGFGAGLGANGLQEGITVGPGLVAEIVLTCLFVLVVLGATSKTNGATNNFAGLAIGLSLILIHLVGIRFTGTSVNPARSIGPALFVGGDALAQLWIFIVGPLVGAVIAAIIWKCISCEKCCCCKDEEEK